MREGFILGRAILKAKVSYPGWLFSWCYYNHPVMTSIMQKKQPLFFFFFFFEGGKETMQLGYFWTKAVILFLDTLFTFPSHPALFIKRQTIDLGTACPFRCRSLCWQLCPARRTCEGLLNLAQQELLQLARGLPCSHPALAGDTKPRAGPGC